MCLYIYAVKAERVNSRGNALVIENHMTRVSLRALAVLKFCKIGLYENTLSSHVIINNLCIEFRAVKQTTNKSTSFLGHDAVYGVL
jgi:hypothetical protein